MYTINKKVAVTPFPSTQTKVEVDARTGLPVIKQKRELTKLTVVYDAWEDELPYVAGDVILVPGDMCKHAGIAGHVYELEPGKPFILVPADQIIGFYMAPGSAEDPETAS